MKLNALVFALIAIASPFAFAADAAAGKASYAICVACHGVDGEGNKALNSPAIAGQEAWYVERQLKNYKDGVRGADPKDVYGLQMRPMAMTLANDEIVANVAAYVQSLAPVALETSITGDAARGKTLYVICATCHGQDGKGLQAMNSPSLVIQQDWYTARQIANFKAGLRGSHAKDTFGMQMKPMAMTLADDAAINDVVAYISTLR